MTYQYPLVVDKVIKALFLFLEQLPFLQIAFFLTLLVWVSTSHVKRLFVHRCLVALGCQLAAERGAAELVRSSGAELGHHTLHCGMTWAASSSIS